MKITSYQHETIVQAETSREAFGLAYYLFGLKLRKASEQIRTEAQNDNQKHG